MADIFSVRATAGNALLSFRNLPTSSAAICILSEALPPLPNIKILFPDFIAEDIIPARLEIAGSCVLRSEFFTRILSFIDRDIFSRIIFIQKRFWLYRTKPYQLFSVC